MIEEIYLRSRSNRPRLRVAVMLDDMRLSPSFAASLQQMIGSEFIDLCAVIVDQDFMPPGPRSSLLVRLARILFDSRRRRHLLYALYERLDARIAPTEKAYLDVADIGHLLAGVPILKVSPLVRGHTQRIPDEALSAIRALELDVIVRFGFNILRGEILGAATHGVWSYHHADPEWIRGGPAGIWELIERQPTTGACLQVLNETLDGGLVLAKVVCPTTRGMSAARNRAGSYSAAQPLLIAKLRQLHEEGWEAVRASCPAPVPYRGRRRIYKMPTNREMAGFALREVARAVTGRIRADDLPPWQIALRRASALAPWEGSWSSFKWITSPAGRFFADPQLIEVDGRTWLFVEDYIYARKRGVISCAEVMPDGALSDWTVVLEQPHHLSFPQVFQVDGQLYLMPEMAGAGRQELFRAEKFPYTWHRAAVLWKGPVRDTVACRGEGGDWYFLTTIRDSEMDPGGLFAFHASSLTAEWNLIGNGPVSLDARFSRNAGNLFTLGRQLFRASQDGVPYYGRRMHFHRIDCLNPDRYSEVLVGTRSPDWEPDLRAAHSYTRTEQWEAIDAQRRPRR